MAESDNEVLVDPKPFVNERLLQHLSVMDGRHQLVLTGEIDDFFFTGILYGAMSLDDTMKYHARDKEYEVVVFLDRSINLEFLNPEMSTKFEEVVRGASNDPRVSGRNARQFQPRNSAANQSTQPNPSANPPLAQDSTVTNAVVACGTNTQQSTLDQITRLLKSNTKSLVVFKQPEKMWMIDSMSACTFPLFETIINWCKVEHGHPESLSILVVTPTRLSDFKRFADACGDRSKHSAEIVITLPNRNEYELFFERIKNRFHRNGDSHRLAGVASALRISLYNLSNRVATFFKQSNSNESLESLFDDPDQAVTLEDILAEMEAMVGLKEVKDQIRQLVKLVESEQQQRRLGEKVPSRNYHMFFLGNPGTGKTVVARLIARIFWALEIRTSQACIEISLQDIVSAYNEGDTIQLMRDAINRAMGGVLFIDEVYLFAQNEWGKKAIQVLMKEMEDHRDEITVIMAGYEEKMPELFSVNPGFESRVSRKVRFPDYNSDEMVLIFEELCQKNRLELTDAAKEKLHRYVQSFGQLGGFGNARGVRNLFETTESKLLVSNGDTRVIQPEMLPDPISFRESEARALINEVKNDFIGLNRVKDFFEEMFRRQKNAASKGSPNPEHNNCVFLGNPGTGKTTMARRMGNLFYYLGLTSTKDKLLEVDPIADMMSPFPGEYATKIRSCFDRALGGVLFIDEAYQLVSASQGGEVINQIVKLLTEVKYRNMVVILAGYSDEMVAFLKTNPGLKRRFPNTIYFDDFSPDELCDIFYKNVQRDGHRIAESDKDLFHRQLKSEVLRLSKQRLFGNAGAVEQLYQKVKGNQEIRPKTEEAIDPFELRAIDISENGQRIEDIENILAELDRDFVGLNDVKSHIRKIVRDIKYEREVSKYNRGNQKLNTTKSHHLIFIGGMGTGKTTIAQYMSRIYFSLGIVNDPSVVECRGLDLTGSYLGQTKDKVNQLFENKAGRLILIDSIYDLQNKSSMNGADQFSQEALQAIIGNLGDSRNEGTVLILSGSESRMHEFLNENAAFSAYFHRPIHFPDYNREECLEIFDRIIESSGYLRPKETDQFRETALRVIDLYRQDPNFGNSRTIYGMFDTMRSQLVQRVEKQIQPNSNMSEELLFQLHLEDIDSMLPDFA